MEILLFSMQTKRLACRSLFALDHVVVVVVVGDDDDDDHHDDE